MKRLALIAAAAAACSVGIPVLAYDGWHRGPGPSWYFYYGPSYGPYYAPYAPGPYYGPPRYSPGPRYVYPYYPRYWVYPPPPVVERVPEPPIVQRRYAEAAPRAEPAAPQLERYTLSAQELFSFDRAGLRGPNAKLDEIASAMKRHPEIDRVRITGYTDRLGTDAYNLKLSQRRADAVKRYLVERGVEARRLVAVGRGKANPVAECHDKDRASLIRCLEPNRRVEVEQIVVERARR